MSDHLRHHRRGKVVRRHRGLGWCDAFQRHTPQAIIAACKRAEADIFGFDDLGTQATIRRNARVIAALMEYSGIRVVDAARLVGIDVNAAWYVRSKWSTAEQSHRDEWLGRVEIELKVGT